MKEAKSMAFVNAYGVLRTLENLCDMVDEAKAVCRELKKPVSLCFDVTITAEEVRNALASPLAAIIDGVLDTLEKTPPELREKPTFK